MVSIWLKHMKGVWLKCMVSVKLKQMVRNLGYDKTILVSSFASEQKCFHH